MRESRAEPVSIIVERGSGCFPSASLTGSTSDGLSDWKEGKPWFAAEETRGRKELGAGDALQGPGATDGLGFKLQFDHTDLPPTRDGRLVGHAGNPCRRARPPPG